MAAYREAVASFRRTALWNLRTRIANATIVIGVLALVALVFGNAPGVRLAPTLACVIGGLAGLTIVIGAVE
jgi:hypothetical protein